MVVSLHITSKNCRNVESECSVVIICFHKVKQLSYSPSGDCMINNYKSGKYYIKESTCGSEYIVCQRVGRLSM